MSFRRRIVIASGVAVAVAIALASIATYVLVRTELRGQVDDELNRLAGGVFAIRIRGAEGVGIGKVLKAKLPEPKAEAGSRSKSLEVRLPQDPLGGNVGYAQFVNVDGNVIGPPREEVHLPVTPRTLEVARGESGPFLEDVVVNGIHARVLTRKVDKRRAVQAVRSLEGVDQTLDRLTLVLVVVSAGGIGLALGLGLLVGRAALGPVRQLTEAAEHVASTRDLSRRIDAGGRDELARLARSFNTMLAALERSLGAQRQLVADASHELRTPLTSLRTNVEVLAGAEQLDPEERERVLGDVVAQLEELTVLVGDLVDLAREEERAPAHEHVRFDELIAAAIARAGRHAPAHRFLAELEPCTVWGSPQRLERAVSNLLDNAVKWSPPDEPIEVTLGDGELRVRDGGQGFDEADLDHVFDRFYRAPSARGLPGSGLGLAIVRQVAESHGGSVGAGNAPTGGGLLALRLPTEPLDAPEATLGAALTTS
jgi:two-component system sensor histidine kinase MprB